MWNKNKNRIRKKRKNRENGQKVGSVNMMIDG